MTKKIVEKISDGTALADSSRRHVLPKPTSLNQR